MVAVKSGDRDLGAERCLGERNRDDAVQVFAFALEEGVFLHVEDDVQIAGGTAVCTGLPLAGVADLRAVFNAFRDGDGKYLLAKLVAFTAARLAGISDDSPCSAAAWASLRDAEEAALH